MYDKTSRTVVRVEAFHCCRNTQDFRW